MKYIYIFLLKGLEIQLDPLLKESDSTQYIRYNSYITYVRMITSIYVYIVII